MTNKTRTYQLIWLLIMSLSFPSPGNSQESDGAKLTSPKNSKQTERQKKATATPGVQLIGIGSVEEVISGDPKLAQNGIKLTPYLAGFEAGSPRGPGSIGEFISFNGLGYTRSTSSKDLGSLVTGKKIFTNGAVFIAKDSKPLQKMRLESLSLAELCQKSVSSAGGAVFIVGILDLEVLEGTGITAPPVANENLFDNKDKYYANGNWKKENVTVAVVGCAAVLGNEKPKLVDELGVVLYNNPNEPVGNLVLHVHALELKQAISSIEQIDPANAVNVHHLFGRSKIRQANISIFKVDGVRPIPNLPASKK